VEFVFDGRTVLMDDEDYAQIFLRHGGWWLWQIGRNSYVRRQVMLNGKRRNVSLHRLVMGATPGQMVDHINGNGLDNRRQNLRFVTSAQNNRNRRVKVGSTSRFKGVSHRRDRGTWRAMITVDGRQISLGCFSDEVEAAFAYDTASLQHHGDYGSRNFLPLA